MNDTNEVIITVIILQIGKIVWTAASDTTALQEVEMQ